MPSEPSAKIRISEIGTFDDLAGDVVAADVQPAPNGITANAASAVDAETTGATM